MQLIERVATSVNDAATRATFYDAHPTVYADAIVVAAREQNAAHALEVAARYAEHAGRAGRAAASQRLREREQAIPLRGPNLTKEDIERNKAIVRALADARKQLSS